MEIGYGPDKVSYEEALQREWDKQPGINPQRNSARSVAPVRKRRYTDKSRNNSSNKEGIMPRRPAAAAAAEAEEAETESAAAEPAEYADKAITPAAQAFAEWITDQTGHDHEGHERSVYLAMSLRRKFQADPATRDRIAEIRDERKPAKPAAEEPEGEEAPAKTTRTKAATTTSTSSTSKPAGRTRAKPGPAPAGRPAGRTRSKAGAAAPF